MKTISFIRHAKSDRPPELPDFERVLNDRGEREAPLMGKVIKDKFILPDLILSSSAYRAHRTSKLIATEIAYPESEIVLFDDLYFADTETYLDIIHDLENNFQNIFIVSHNPGTTYIVNRLSNTRLDNMPTCGIAQIGFETESWNEIEDKSGKILRFDRPKNHR